MHFRTSGPHRWGPFAGLCSVEGEGDPDPGAAPAPEPQEPVAEPSGDPAEPVEPSAAAAEPEPAPQTPEPKKSAISQLQGRVGHLTRVAHEKDAEIAELRAKLAGSPAQPDITPSDYVPASELDRLANERAQQIARAQTFNEKANAVFDQGKAEYTDFPEQMKLLQDLGVLSPTNLNVAEAAMATGDAHKVLYALSQNVEDAVRIASLSPMQMGVELTKLAARVNAAPAKPQVSNAPPPIKPLGGVAQPEPDIYDPRYSSGDTVSADYIAMRAKSGAPWWNRQKAN